VRQGGHNFSLDRDPMRVDLVVKCLAQGNCVFGNLVGGKRLMVVVKPEMELVEKVETRRVGEVVSFRLIVCTDEDGRCKDSLKCLDDPPIVAAVFRQVKKVEHLSGAGKANGATFLADGERCYPDRDKAVLAEGKAETWMACDLQEEPSITPRMDELVSWGATEGDAAQHEGAGMVGKFLVSVVTFFSDNSDSFEMTKSEFRNAERRQCGPHGRERRMVVAAGLRRPTPRVGTGSVPKVFQKSKELGSKGLLIERKQIP
jgi:hypothetical protein